MQLGVVSGKSTVQSFSFEAAGKVRKADYVTVKDPEGAWVLASIEGMEADGSKIRADAGVVGYRDSRGFLKTPKMPFPSGTGVFSAEPKFIRDTIGLKDSGAYIGLLDGYDLKVRLPIEQLVQKHVSVLAKTGAGKSYLTGVLMEEMAEHGVPVVVIDPHGEYHTLQSPNPKPSERGLMKKFGVEPKPYRDSIRIFGFGTGNEITLGSHLSSEEIFSMLPARPTSSQKSQIYSALRNLEGREYSIQDIMDEVRKSKSPARWDLLTNLEFLQKSGLFSTKPTAPEELVEDGKITIIDLKQARPEIQQMVVLKTAEELFSARKAGKIPPFLFVLEEAHNFCPERGFGEVASSRIIRTIASEGRKFGMGLMVVSQRPARVDKSVLSQCNTQIILKLTNPNDLKAISESMEGMTTGTKESIRDLPVGVAMVVGVSESPLMVDIRIRRSEHGGDAVKVEQKEPDDSESGFMFESKVSKESILSRWKGADEIDFLKYPLWKASSRSGKAIYLDGIAGLLIYESEGSLERSAPKGSRKAFTIPREPDRPARPGIILEPSVKEGEARRILSGMGFNPERVEMVFYPYWLVKKKGSKILVDAVLDRIDPEAIEAIRDRV